nr:hypothetical protein HK105_008224 [Polyrhizophydium stewartii]
MAHFAQRKSMVKRARAEVLVTNLPQLQNKIKRDPPSYRDEFLQQWRHFESTLAIFNLKPQGSAISEDFAAQIMFISHCYPAETKEFPEKLIGLLSNHYQIMAPEVRKTMVQALILMRNRGMIQPTRQGHCIIDKSLREMLHSHIVNDIKSSNAKSKNNAMNKTLQNFMYTMLSDTNETAAKKSLEVMIELYRKNIWNDAKTVNVIADACFSPIPKIVAAAVHFFLGTNEKEDDSDSDDDLPDMSSLRHANRINKKKKSRAAMLDKAKATVKRRERNKNRAEHFNFSALHLINDPQGFAEKMFARLRQASKNNMFRFDLRLSMISLVSRLIGVHKLILLGFYSFLIPYLKPQQKDVTLILAYAAQSSHELVPPDAIEAVVRAIADNFVWSNCASEVATAGLNGLREICARCPLAMPEELLKSLLEDYKNHREKGPMNAARSLLGLYRDVNPEMLRKKDRGKAATINIKNFKAKTYGQVDVMDSIDGLEVLDENSDVEMGSDDDDEAPELVSIGEDDGDDDWEDVSDDEEVEGEEDEYEVALPNDGDDDGEDDDDEDGDEDDEEEMLEEVDDGEDDEDEDKDDDDDDNDEDDDDDEEGENEEDVSQAKKRRINIMAEKILTDEDFARIRERRLEREAERLAGIKGKRAVADDSDDSDNDPDVVDVSRIMSGTRKKNDYEARLESIKIKSKRTKAFMMMVHKREVRGKAQRSLREKQKVLRAHIKKQKMRI